MPVLHYGIEAQIIHSGRRYVLADWLYRLPLECGWASPPGMSRLELRYAMQTHPPPPGLRGTINDA